MIEPVSPTSLRRGATSEVGPRAGSRSLRAAIYTRKSTTDGLDQDFNSLDAQREACEEYVRGKERDGWVLIPHTYEDGGRSGATVNRPAFQELLGDIEAGKVSCVVVHRLDRLSRSLLDFAHLMSYFQEKGTSFVSVTQNFSTADAVGRLTLHLLASFAEFERGMISERTMAKVHAARRKGKWTGGHPPLGLDLDPGLRRLVVNLEEAELVRAIFRVYLESLSLTRTVEELSRRCWTRKRWTTKQGREHGGEPFDTVTLYRLLTNPIYVGKVRLKGREYDGEHERILDDVTWGKVQSHIRHNGTTGGNNARNKHHALLRGILRCGHCGSAMSHSFTTKKNGIRYRYYRCTSSIKKGSFACPNGSAPADAIERQVIERIREIARDPELVAETVRQARAQLEERRKLLDAERRQLTRDLGHQKVAMKRLVGSANVNGDLAGRLVGIQGRIRAMAARLSAIGREITAAQGLVIDEHDVARALEAFGPVWDSLWPTERARIIAVLTEAITYDGRDKSISIRLRGDGIRSIRQPEPESRIRSPD